MKCSIGNSGAWGLGRVQCVKWILYCRVSVYLVCFKFVVSFACLYMMETWTKTSQIKAFPNLVMKMDF